MRVYNYDPRGLRNRYYLARLPTTAIKNQLIYTATATTDMQEKTRARLRESRLLAPSARKGKFTQPTLHLSLHIWMLADSQLLARARKWKRQVVRARES